MSAGKFIVIEGIDGSGKATQARMLAEHLQNLRINVESISFPSYNASSYFIKEFLNGKYGKDISPEIVALFYALDRFDQKDYIRNTLIRGTWIVCDRYVLSNLAHQTARLDRHDKQWEFIQKLIRLEHETLGLPIPDKTFLLNTPVQKAQSQIANRGRESDIIEGDILLQQKTASLYNKLASTQGAITIQSTDIDHTMKSPEAIHREIVYQLKDLF